MYKTEVNNQAVIFSCGQNVDINRLYICQSQGVGGLGAHFEIRYNHNIIDINDDGSCLFRALLLFDYIEKNNIPATDGGFLNSTLLKKGGSV